MDFRTLSIFNAARLDALVTSLQSHLDGRFDESADDKDDEKLLEILTEELLGQNEADISLRDAFAPPKPQSQDPNGVEVPYLGTVETSKDARLSHSVVMPFVQSLNSYAAGGYTVSGQVDFYVSEGDLPELKL